MSVAASAPEQSVERTAEPAREPTNRELLREESAIARKYIGRVPWEMVAWCFGNLFLWLSIWPLTFAGILPLWAGFIISTVCIAVCYLPSHEAQHSIIAAEGTKLRWLNDLVGHVSVIPMVFPYRFGWITHRQHHAHANNPDLDPDHDNKGETWWKAVWNGIQARQPGSDSAYKTVARESDDPNIQRALLEATVLTAAYYLTLTVLAWSGHGLEAVFLWWLPRHIGTSYIQLVLSWAPHHPMEETGRYRDTRAWRSPFGTFASLWMEYHIVHHLYPTIPLLQTGPAYWEMRDLLEKRGVRNDGL